MADGHHGEGGRGERRVPRARPAGDEDERRQQEREQHLPVHRPEHTEECVGVPAGQARLMQDIGERDAGGVSVQPRRCGIRRRMTGDGAHAGGYRERPPDRKEQPHEPARVVGPRVERARLAVGQRQHVPAEHEEDDHEGVAGPQEARCPRPDGHPGGVAREVGAGDRRRTRQHDVVDHDARGRQAAQAVQGALPAIDSRHRPRNRQQPPGLNPFSRESPRSA